MKPILFNTEMVKAILDGRKTQTRRIIKVENPDEWDSENDCMQNEYGAEVPCFLYRKQSTEERSIFYPKYQVGDILYVRESGMIQSMKNFGKKVKILFKADDSLVEFDVSDGEYARLLKWESFKKWISPYWLTKETARIFIKVTNVRVERLKDINTEESRKEGVSIDNWVARGGYGGDDSPFWIEAFAELWDSTIKKSDIENNGWNANPWVWVYEFERCEKPEEEKE